MDIFDLINKLIIGILFFIEFCIRLTWNVFVGIIIVWLTVIWLGIVFGSIVGIILLLIFAPHLFLLPVYLVCLTVPLSKKDFIVQF